MTDDEATPDVKPEKAEPAFTPLGMPPASPIRSRDGDVIHTGPEFAVGEGDVRSAERSEVIIGTSLWRDAWRRLLKNKLAVFGMVVVAIITLASLVGPYLIRRLTGLTPDYIPTDVALLKSLPPFTAADG